MPQLTTGLQLFLHIGIGGKKRKSTFFFWFSWKFSRTKTNTLVEREKKSFSKQIGERNTFSTWTSHFLASSRLELWNRELLKFLQFQRSRRVLQKIWNWRYNIISFFTAARLGVIISIIFIDIFTNTISAHTTRDKIKQLSILTEDRRFVLGSKKRNVERKRNQ